MATIKPFIGIRPSKEKAASIAALPYDVYSREEARKVVENDNTVGHRTDQGRNIKLSQRLQHTNKGKGNAGGSLGGGGKRAFFHYN